MAGVLELIDKILNEQREVVQARDRSAIANQSVVNMRTTNAGQELENQGAQAAFRADLELAQRRYPNMDPVEALVKFKADTQAEDRDVKARTAEQALSTSEARAAEDMANAAKLAADAGRAPEERASKARLDKLNEELKQLEAENMRKFGRRQVPIPPRGRAPAAPKAVPASMVKEARRQLFLAGNDNPTAAELNAMARELMAGGTGGSAAGAGVSAPPAAAAPPGAAPPPVAPAPVAAGACPPGSTLWTAPGKPDVCVKAR